MYRERAQKTAVDKFEMAQIDVGMGGVLGVILLILVVIEALESL